MNVLILIFTLLVAGFHPIAASEKAPLAPKPERVEQDFSPQVKLFIARCLDDEKQEYKNVQAWLKLQKIAQPDRDRMWEILSGLVWNLDQQRARFLALDIKNRDKREQVLGHYESMEQLPKP